MIASSHRPGSYVRYKSISTCIDGMRTRRESSRTAVNLDWTLRLTCGICRSHAAEPHLQLVAYSNPPRSNINTQTREPYIVES